MVAIQMAGGALVPIDPAFPLNRKQGTVDDTQAKLILTAPNCKASVNGLEIDTIWEISAEFFLALKDEPLDQPLEAKVKPENAAFVIFTSGSTGKPKGLLHEHKSLCSTSKAWTENGHVHPGTRVYTYSHYTFDVGIVDVMATLYAGACVCVPSEDDRFNNIAGSIKALQATWIFLTPTVASLIDPADVPTLKTVILGGEPSTTELLHRWNSKVDLYTAYGPAEALTNSLRSIAATASVAPRNIGKPLVSAYWVCRPDDIKTLVPVGSIGELIIQGPMLARGYISASPEANAAWLENVDWLPGGVTRAYRTGDLVRRMADGTFDYIGRQDSQVKVRGQRVELGEIESHIRNHLPENMNVAVDVLRSDDTGSENVTAMM